MQTWEGEARGRLNEQLKQEQRALLDEQTRASGRFDDGLGRLSKAKLRRGRRDQFDDAAAAAAPPLPAFEPMSVGGTPLSSLSPLGAKRTFGRALSEITRGVSDEEVAKKAAQREELTAALAEQMREREAKKLAFKLKEWDEAQADLRREGYKGPVGKPRPDIPADLVPYLRAAAPERMAGSRFGPPMLADEAGAGPQSLSAATAAASSVYARGAAHRGSGVPRGAGASSGVAAALWPDSSGGSAGKEDAFGGGGDGGGKSGPPPPRLGRRRFPISDEALQQQSPSPQSQRPSQPQTQPQTQAQTQAQPHQRRQQLDYESEPPSARSSSERRSLGRGGRRRPDDDIDDEDGGGGARKDYRVEDGDRGQGHDGDDGDGGGDGSAQLAQLAAVEARLDRIMAAVQAGGFSGAAGGKGNGKGGGGSKGMGERRSVGGPVGGGEGDLAGIMRELLQEQRHLRDAFEAKEAGAGSGVARARGAQRGSPGPATASSRTRPLSGFAARGGGGGGGSGDDAEDDGRERGARANDPSERGRPQQQQQQPKQGHGRARTSSGSAAVGGRHRAALASARDYEYDDAEAELDDEADGPGGGVRPPPRVAALGRVTSSAAPKRPAFGRHAEGVVTAAQRRAAGEAREREAAGRRAAALEAFKGERQELREAQQRERLERAQLRRQLPFNRKAVIEANAAAVAAVEGGGRVRDHTLDRNSERLGEGLAVSSRYAAPRQQQQQLQPPQHQQRERGRHFDEPDDERDFRGGAAPPPPRRQRSQSQGPGLSERLRRQQAPEDVRPYDDDPDDSGAAFRDNHLALLHRQGRGSPAQQGRASYDEGDDDEGDEGDAALLPNETRFIFPARKSSAGPGSAPAQRGRGSGIMKLLD